MLRQLTIGVALLASVVAADEPLKDPRTRDEDISGVSIISKIEKLSDGSYRYSYDVGNSGSALENISFMELDVFCPNMPDVGLQRRSVNSLEEMEDLSKDGRHVVLLPDLVGFDKQMSGISVDNVFSTGLFLGPGNNRQFTLTSTAKPGYLHYALTVSMTDEKLYDYSEVDYDTPGVLRYQDWEVHGLTRGPACAGAEATPLTRPIFQGQRMPSEKRDVNALLRYEVKGNRNRWHDLATTTSVALRIYYGYGFEPTTFAATINGRDVSGLFDPANKMGQYEDVVLPLDGPRTVIEFRVCPPSAKWEGGGYDYERCDIDPFEIRRPLTPAP